MTAPDGTEVIQFTITTKNTGYMSLGFGGLTVEILCKWKMTDTDMVICSFTGTTC